MDNENMKEPQVISLRPAAVFAFFKVFPLIICTLGFLFLAWWIYPVLIWLSLLMLIMAVYRFTYIRKVSYLITPEFVRISQGIFFKRTDQVELFRVKDYIITQSFLLQVFRLMNLELRSTDPVNPIVWLLGIPHSDLVDTIREHVQEGRQHNRIFEIN
jgi:membrane protein YdbS with pleckstrin-like domain